MGSRSKSCRLALFQICGTLLAVVGVILCIIGVATSALFASLLKGKNIRRVDIFFGLFKSNLQIEYSNGTLLRNTFTTHFSDVEASNWRGAQALCVLSLLVGLVVLTLHILIVCAKVARKWYTVLVGLILHLLIVSFLIAGIALVETHLYYLNAYGDRFLLKLLRRHDLLRYIGGPLVRNFRGPMLTYWILVASDFCFLFAMLSSLPEFIYLAGESRRRKREKREQKPARL